MLALLAIVLTVGAGLAFGSRAFAQVVDPTSGLESFAEAAGFTSQGDLTVIIARLIRTAISFLGILAVVFVLYGGFLYMTAGGNDDKVKRAKKVFTSAIIGLVIVLSAFAIVQFVLSQLTSALGGGVSGTDDGDGGTYVDGGGTSDEFLLTSVNTECAEAMKNLQLQFTFSQRVDGTSVDAGGILVETGGTAVDGAYAVSGKRVTFTPSAVCEEDADERCFEASTPYSVTVDSAVLESTSGKTLVCSTEYPCSFSFTTGTAVDTEGPTLTMDAPETDASVYVNDIELLQAIAIDDTGVSSVDFSVDGDVVYQAAVATDSTEGSLATTNYFYTADGTQWDTAGYETGSYTIRSEGADCAGHSDSASVSIALRPAYCDNGVQDEDETDVDCGGDECGACDGESCDSDDDCSSGYCDETTGECVGVPKIEEVSPGDGAEGNLVSISGENFGETADSVTFLGDATTTADDVVISAYECNGAVQWSDDEIIVQIESSMADGPVLVETSDGYGDQTDDDYGPTIEDFDVNGVVRPGICMLDPDSDVGNSQVDVTGNNFGSSQGTSTVYFTNYEASSYDAWADAALSVVVPLLNARDYRTQVWAGDYQCVNSDGSLVGTTCAEDADCDTTDGQSCATMQCSESGEVCEEDADCAGEDESCVSLRQGSNKVTFTVVDASAGESPVISQVVTGWEACSDDNSRCGRDSDCTSGTCDDADNWGPPGQYVTIYGTAFGTATGTVTFTGDFGYALGDTVFPDACGDDTWDDTEITVKVPATYQAGGAIGAGTYALTVETALGAESEGTEFVVLDDEPGPGICNMAPSSGPAGTTTVVIDGDNFTNEQGAGYVEFYDGEQVSAPDYWNASQVQSLVDADASTGPVFIVTDEGYESNTVNFEVGDCNEDATLCGTGEQCCGDGSCDVSCGDEIPTSHYAWLFSTGDIPATPRVSVFCGDVDDDGNYDGVSPGPWENWSNPSDICVNAAVTATFTEVMDQESFEGNVLVQACDGADEEDPCANLEDTDDTNDLDVAGSVVSTGEYTFEWDPTDHFSTSTTYRVTLESDGIRSAAGASMARDYAWEFTTSSSTDLCEVGEVYVSPSAFTAVEEDELVDYTASPIAENDDCVPLQCTGYSWNWESSDTSRAELTGDDLGDDDACENTAQALAQTIVGSPVEIEAGPDGVRNSPTDTGDLTINFTDPEVTSWEPSCSTACLNAGLRVEFNTGMTSTDFAAGSTVVLYECEDSLCDSDEVTEFSDTYAILYSDSGDTHALSISHDDFAVSSWYRVVISGDVESASGIALSESGSNEGSDANQYFTGDFSWKFKTKSDTTPCSIDRIEMLPSEASATVIGEQTAFEALPYGAPDDCSASGQLLDDTDYDWDAWTASDSPNISGTAADVAEMIDGGMLALSYNLADGCSSDCLNVGSSVTTDDPVCGDGRVTYGEECDGGADCTDECLNAGNDTACSSTVTTGCCGDGITDSDEECDDGNSSSSDGCSSVCLNNGARKAGTTCGDGIWDQSSSTGGEDDDDGNSANGDGLSSDCLYEGGEDVSGVYATCGNGIVEDGEDCEDNSTDTDKVDDGDGCSSECLFEGAPACAYECVGGIDDGQNCSGLGAATCDFVIDGDGLGDCEQAVTPCCGDNETDYDGDLDNDAEDCDDANTDDGDGCSSECLNEGSSVSYATASYCGDGDVETGEECEATGSLSVGNHGVSRILETAPQDVLNGVAGAEIGASSTGERGTAELSLSCSCNTDDSCGNESAYGCGTGSCCFSRPDEIVRYPASAALDVCRNTAVYVDFTDVMDDASLDPSGDLTNPNLYLELVTLNGTAVDSTNCPDGSEADEPNYVDAQLAFVDDGSRPWFARTWNWLVGSVRSLFGLPATAATYACVVPVTYAQVTTDDGARVSMNLSDLLMADSRYRFVIVEDSDASDATDEGVLSANAVGIVGPSDGEDDTTFDTGSEVCELEDVTVEDLGLTAALTNDLLDPSVEYFTEDGEEHTIRATANTVRGGSREEIAEIPDVYEWTWAWDSTECDDETSAACADNVIDMTDADSTSSDATAEGSTGRETLVATASFDDTNTFGDITDAVSGELRVTANVCDNPPTIGFPYEDTDTNFSFFYCRDAGDESTTADDLPELEAPVEVLTSYSGSSILKELIFKVSDTSDAIGVRVLPNDSYLPPGIWYATQGFTGSPTEDGLDGYDAVRDGNTLYVAAANYDDSTDIIYPNVYVVSYTENADAEAQEIFDQMLENWSFNSNDDAVTDVNVCVSGGAYATDVTTGELVRCEWDADCASVGSGYTCDALKAELTRDMNRLTDVAYAVGLLEEYGDENGYCVVTTDQSCDADSDCPGDETCEPGVPTLATGTFVRSYSTSTWPSWSAELGNALGAAVPEDPINEFSGCTDDGYESATCWNASAATFECPEGSHVYGYRSVGGSSFDLYAQLEYTAGTWAYDFESTLGDLVIEQDWGGSTSALMAGFTATPTFCDGTAYGDSAVCGDGVLGSGEFCEIGDTYDADCDVTYSYQCADPSTYFPAYARTCSGLDDTTSCTGTYYDTCVETSTGSFICAALETTTGSVFNACSDFDDSTCSASRHVCAIIGQTGMGKITTTCESDCSGYQTAAEAEAAGAECAAYDCGNGVVEEDNGEECDDGSLNGSYGHCGDTCTLDDAFYCGDGYLAGGEDCDCGEVSNFTAVMADSESWANINTCTNSNGQWELNPAGTCAWDCTSPGPSCGDGEINGEEECDGDYESWDGAWCANGDACSTDGDCEDGSVCGSGMADCGIGSICVGGADEGTQCDDGSDCDSAVCSEFTYELSRARTCDSTCSWDISSWSECHAGTQYCGNGSVEGDEECDDGNTANTDACTNDCVGNVCGDENVYSGVESCDDGVGNGDVCDAAYGGTCNYCTTTCTYQARSGAYCGDGEIGATELCDGASVPYYCVDTSSGEADTSDTCLPADVGTSTGCDSGYTCRSMGACNGGDDNGEKCTIDATSGTDTFSCGSDGECVPPTCADDCTSMCPFSYETTSILAQTEEAGADAEESIELYDYLSGNSPDNAVFYLPACTVGTQITADVDTDDVEPPSIAMYFLTDYTGTMEANVDGDYRCDDDADGYADSTETVCTSSSSCSSGITCERTAPPGYSRMDIVSAATADAIGRIYDEFSTSDIRIGLMRVYAGSESPTDFFAGAGYVIDEPIHYASSESGLVTTVEGYAAESGLGNGPPLYVGMKAAIDELEGVTADAKFIVVLSDGETYIGSDMWECGTSSSATQDSHTCEDGTTVSACGSSNYYCCAREVDLGLLDECNYESDTDGAVRGEPSSIKVYTAAITESATSSYSAYMAHISSETCTDDYSNINDCTTGTYAFSAQDEDGIAAMYDAIVDSMLGVTFNLTTEVDEEVQLTTGFVNEGRNQTLPFPSNFECTGADTSIPFTLDFNGDGFVTISDITFTYCPAP